MIQLSADIVKPLDFRISLVREPIVVVASGPAMRLLS